MSRWVKTLWLGAGAGFRTVVL
eukprot:COSAG06_NODE_60109_length_272_cov_0.583815_1_plen_21_part_10